MMTEDQDEGLVMKDLLYLGHPQIGNLGVMFWEEEDL